MRFGAVLPTGEIGTDPGAIREFAQAADDLGYSSIVVYDHVLGAVHAGREKPLTGPYTENDPFREPLVLLGFLAACTRTVELATGVLNLPQRQTALVAKQAAEIDLLSGGRLRLGVGIGWNHVEYEALGVPFAERGLRLDEGVEVLRQLWTEHVVDHTGRYHRIDRAGILPRPERSIPVWFGGSSEAAIARAARNGDGFTFTSCGDRVCGLAEDLLGQLDDAGRSRAGFGLEATVDHGEGPDTWRDKAKRWADLGGTDLCIRTMRSSTAFLGLSESSLADPAAHITALETFMTTMSGAD